MSQAVISSDEAVRRDDEARQRIQQSLDESLVVEAAAGTGKTKMLVDRLVGVLAQGKASVDQVVAVTFTRKAAGELKLRLRQALDKARRESQAGEESERLEQAIARLEEARIGTIHSFCAEILRERPVEAGVDPAFEELSETEAPRLFNQAFRRWVQEKLDELPEGLRRSLTRMTFWDSAFDSSPMDRLRSAGWLLVEWRDFPAAWRRDEIRRQEEIEAVIESVVQLADLSGECPYPGDQLRKALSPAREFATWHRRAEVSGGQRLDTMEALLGRLLRDLRRSSKRKGRGVFSDKITRQQVLDARAAVMAQLEALMRRLDADLACVLRSELDELVERYEELKRRSGKLDFVDLLIRTRDLLQRDESVRRFFQERFSHIFVDEFQDTDPLQAEILILLAADSPDCSDWRSAVPRKGKLFLVGDPKQSIYRFRRADVMLYQQIREMLQERGVALVQLSKSYRAAAPLQALVNAAFSAEMTGDAVSGQPDYVPLFSGRDDEEQSVQPTAIALPVPFPYGWRQVTRRAVEASLPDAVAAFVDWLVNQSGWTVRNPDKPEERIPIAARHICILFRRFVSWGADITREYTSGLEARGVPHLLVGARSFQHREEVETLRAALCAIEWPDDELSVYAALKGTLFAISDNLLLRFKLEIGRLHPFRPLPLDADPCFGPIAEALSLLRELHRGRNQRPIAQTLSELLEATRAHAGFALRPAGNQVLANVQKVCDMARSFELGGGLSFRGFVEQFGKASESQGSSEGPLLEEGAEGVRLMTVHAAKGLEFPVVVLADLTASLARNQPDKYVDLEKGLCAMRLLGCSPWELLENSGLERVRDEAEGVRIAYVAATRARDLLAAPVVGDERMEGWLSPLNKALYPTAADWRKSAKGPGCPDFGDSSVAQRPMEHHGRPDFSVRPGLHKPQTGSHDVVWWDPRLLRLGIEANFGIQQEQILAEDPGGVRAREGLERYLGWKRRREESTKSGSRPAFEVFTASEVEEGPPEGKHDLRIEILERDEDRASGKLFGTLVHNLLRDVDFKAGEAEVLKLARLHGRVLGADSEQIVQAVAAVLEALRHPLLRQAREADRTYRELPILLRSQDGRIMEGTIDLLFLAQGIWTVLDFKTDSDLGAQSERQLAQLSWYLEAVTQLTGQPARGVLLGL